MTENTHKKLNLWLDTIYKCVRIAAVALTMAQPHTVVSDAAHERAPAVAVRTIDV